MQTQTPFAVDVPTGPMPITELDDAAPGADLSAPTPSLPSSTDLLVDDAVDVSLVDEAPVEVSLNELAPVEVSLVAPDPAPAKVVAAVNPPTSVHVAYTPTQVVDPVVAAVSVPPIPPVPPVPSAGSRRQRRQARRRSRWVVAGAAVAAVSLLLVGVALALTSNGGGDDVEVAQAPAAAAGDQAADAAPATQDDQAVQDDQAGAAVEPPAVDDADVARAQGTVAQFLAVRGTDAERAVSSQKGRTELDQVAGQLGRAVIQGDAECSAADTAGTFTCVQATDQGAVTFTVGPDVDDPATSGFEVIGAAIA